MHKLLTPPVKNGVSASKIIINSYHTETCLDFLCMKLPNYSRELWLKRILNGEVLDENLIPINPLTPLKHKNRLYYYRYLPEELPIPFDENILYQDDYLVVADKPHFLPVIPTGKYLQQTLLVRLRKKLKIDTLTPIHRIDRETAGLVLFSKQKNSRDEYQSMFRNNLVSKEYEAIAPRNDRYKSAFKYQSRIIQSDNFMKMQTVEGIPNSETIIEMIHHNKTLGKYRLKPITGKKHQLRIQLCTLGIPIINDRIYPTHYPESVNQEMIDDEYQYPLQLVAKKISFKDPFTGKYKEFESSYNVDLPSIK